MFYLYHHHDLSRLAELLAALLQRHRPASPLVADQVIVPNRGVERWLQAQLAENEGIVANVAFPLPATFIWADLLSQLRPEAKTGGYFRERMVWHLFRLLPDIAAEDDAVARYLAAEPPDIQRLQLAERLADVFDQYQVFRGDMLECWSAGRTAGDAFTEQWQSRVWRTLERALGGENRTAVLRDMVRELPTAALPAHPLYCFGIADLPPDYLRLLYALSQVRDVHFLLPNPSDGYWSDISRSRLSLTFPRHEESPPEAEAVEAGHPLLAAMGGPVRDFIHLLYSQEMTAIQEPELGELMAYEPPPDPALLSRIQSGIIRLSAVPEGLGMEADDHSLQVHACHGPLREVQVLHDQLLDLLGRVDGLRPRDIVVMVPDLTGYASAIRSVFGAAQGRHHIPWSLSGQPRWASHPVVQTFRELLDLPLSRWTASDVLSLAAVPAVMRRFDLDEAGLDTLSLWVRESGVRWGLDADTRESLGAGRFDENSWMFGLDRLLLGSVLNDEETLLDDVAPWSDLEGGATSMLGRLYRLVQELQGWQRALERDRPAADWRRDFNALLERLFEIDAEDRAERDALDAIHSALDVLQTAGECLDDHSLSWLALREALVAALNGSGVRQPFLSGGVTFTDMETLAGVPFRVVCLLGMNDGSFPRQDGGREFNFMLHRRQLGDRLNRDADRQAFLQALLAARDVFYLSYTGHDVRSGEDLEPATPVSEFLDFVRMHHFAGWERQAADARLLTRQPMQPFSRRYFQAERPLRVFTFAAGWRRGAEAQFGQRRTGKAFLDGSQAQPPDSALVELDSLRSFFRNPPRQFLRERLGLWLEETASALEDDERFRLDPIAGWQLRSRLLESGADAGERPSRLWQRRGMLPPPPLDLFAWQPEADAVRALAPVRRDWYRRPMRPLDVDLMLPCGQRLAGRINDVRPGGLYRIRPGRLAMRAVLGDWIDYLAVAASGEPAALRLAGLQDGEADVRQAQVRAEEALDALDALVRWYREGQSRPLAFQPDVAETYMEERAKRLDKGLAPEEADALALDHVNQRLDPSGYSPHYALSDPYFSLTLLPGSPLGAEPGDTEFCELCKTVCGLLRQRLQVMDNLELADV
ncbi:MAG: exodeoxyribonuclease V subunit gamma [Ectothiorhodospiraceae bacterium]|nr:exodeoxyribonuclease V subunit gamma [Ectothiorhodospiraceae bacterium]